jgi:F-type H+-transporting ATPase subunit beta
VHFPQHLPEIYSRLTAGLDNEIIIEVVTHLDVQTVRGIALTPTPGIVDLISNLY